MIYERERTCVKVNIFMNEVIKQKEKSIYKERKRERERERKGARERDRDRDR